MAIRLNPHRSDGESDLETQLLAIGALIAGNVMSGALLLNKLQRQRNTQQNAPLPPLYDQLPRVSVLLFLGVSVYFLALSKRDVEQQPDSPALKLVLAANVLSTAATGLKTQVVFTSPPESAATVGAAEQ